MKTTLTLLATSASILGGCDVSTDRVTFVTSTELAVASIDPSVGNVNVGYDRSELVITPAFPDTGEVPPVFASVNGNGNPLFFKTQQVYATGNSADLITATNDDDRPAKPCSSGTPENCPEYRGKRRVLVFGTTTTFGLKAEIAGTSVEEGFVPNIVIGIKRREAASIPMTLEEDSQAAGVSREIASVIAGISVGSEVRTGKSTGLPIQQFMATGKAAENVAANGCVGEQLNATKTANEAAQKRSIELLEGADDVAPTETVAKLTVVEKARRTAVVDLYSRCFDTIGAKDAQDTEDQGNGGADEGDD